MPTQANFWRTRTTWIGAAMILVFQLVFSIVWMTGYQGIDSRLDQLKIGVVPMDRSIGADIASQLIESLKFDVQIVEEETLAKEKLIKRDIQMAVIIPVGLAEQIQSGTRPGSLPIWVNESNPALIKSAMQNVSAIVAKEVNRKATYVTARSIFESMEVNETQATGMALAISEMVKTEWNSLNPVKDTANQMIPMMIVLSAYVGAMIMGMNVQQSVITLQSSVRVWRLWAQRMTLNIGMAILGSGFGLGLILLLGGQLAMSWWEAWLVQISTLFAFMLLSQLFLMVFGFVGMLFNIIALSLQLVTSGVIFPKELLSPLFQNIGQFLPATYAVEGTMNTFFGGPAIWSVIGILLSFIAAITVLMVGLLLIKERWKQPKQSNVTGMTKSL